jgi:hypothetical protein
MADQINSGQIIQKPEIIIPTIFPLPVGVIGVNADDGIIGGQDYVYNADNDKSFELPAIEESVSTTGAEVIDAPSVITVTNQSIRFYSGRLYVDLEVEVEDVPGINNYDLRVTRT